MTKAEICHCEGLAIRLEALSYALKRIHALPLKRSRSTPIQLGALIRLKTIEGVNRTLIFGPETGGEEITVVTARLPLGKAVLGKTVGAKFDFPAGRKTNIFTIVSVELSAAGPGF